MEGSKDPDGKESSWRRKTEQKPIRKIGSAKRQNGNYGNLDRTSQALHSLGTAPNETPRVAQAGVPNTKSGITRMRKVTPWSF